ncbi:uroporphyrinogen-III synthase [Paraflavitalea speifideaquila]|uniref:uroporphyrinogen-III synthase n=1 Tax=Paraflavitalea speifideaquila TaxID=3076558 RepID=UPI0028E4A598|nr:uroporphyrinogen-III synthase [Paraflavitalea speifideiaquila]
MEQKGVVVLEEAFITIKPVISMSKYEEIWPWLIKAGDTAVVFTSQYAVNTVDKYLHGGDAFYSPEQWMAFCLNGTTKEQVVQLLSEEQIIDTAPNATELAAKIIANGQFKQVVFFCGNQRMGTIPNLLKEADIEVVEIVVYENIATPIRINDAFDAALFFSPSSVKSFFSINTLPDNAACFAIGSTTATAISNYTGNKVITSEEPTQEAILNTAWRYLQQID